MTSPPSESNSNNKEYAGEYPAWAQAQASPEEYKQRLGKISLKNTTCADCSSPNPQWASRLILPQGSLGVLICDACAVHHLHELGETRAVIKYVQYIHEFSDRELDILEQTGNRVANSVFEAKLTPYDYTYFRQGLMCEKEAKKRQGKFIRKKYKDGAFQDNMTLRTVLDQMKLVHVGEANTGSTRKIRSSLMDGSSRNRSLRNNSNHSSRGNRSLRNSHGNLSSLALRKRRSTMRRNWSSFSSLKSADNSSIPEEEEVQDIKNFRWDDKIEEDTKNSRRGDNDDEKTQDLSMASTITGTTFSALLDDDFSLMESLKVESDTDTDSDTDDQEEEEGEPKVEIETDESFRSLSRRRHSDPGILALLVADSDEVTVYEDSKHSMTLPEIREWWLEEAGYDDEEDRDKNNEKSSSKRDSSPSSTAKNKTKRKSIRQTPPRSRARRGSAVKRGSSVPRKEGAPLRRVGTAPNLKQAAATNDSDGPPLRRVSTDPKPAQRKHKPPAALTTPPPKQYTATANPEPPLRRASTAPPKQYTATANPGPPLRRANTAPGPAKAKKRESTSSTTQKHRSSRQDSSTKEEKMSSSSRNTTSNRSSTPRRASRSHSKGSRRHSSSQKMNASNAA